MELTNRILSSIRHQGLINTYLRSNMILRDYLFDIKYGVDTFSRIELKKLTINTENKNKGSEYQPSRVEPLRSLFLKIKPFIKDDSVLVDLGCGKGRVLLVASEFGLNKVKGVEFATELCKIANINARIFKTKTGVKTEFEIIESDASKYEINSKDDIFFLFNPFDDSILIEVLQNIDNSLIRNPRRIIIIYLNPQHKKIIEQRGNYKSKKEIIIFGYTYIVYSNSDISLE